MTDTDDTGDKPLTADAPRIDVMLLEYVAVLTAELRGMLHGQSLPTLSYLLAMAHLEAKETAKRLSRDPAPTAAGGGAPCSSSRTR